MKSRYDNQNIDMYQIITNRIIGELEKGHITWRKTWNGYGLARNYATGKIYKGINMLMMNFFTRFEKPYFLSMKQANDLGGRVKKGAKSEQVIYFNTAFKDADNNTLSPQEATTRHDSGQKVKVFKYLKYYNVFNVADIEGIDFNFEGVTLNNHDTIERCEAILNGYPDAPRYESKDTSKAYYSPIFDFINVPPIQHHDTPEDYYCTFFHELVHSTGHAKRLCREEVINLSKFGSFTYSCEELTAEIGAAFLCHIAQIENTALIENTAAYIQGWLKQLRNDKQFVFRAAAEAQKAIDYIYKIEAVAEETANYQVAA